MATVKFHIVNIEIILEENAHTYRCNRIAEIFITFYVLLTCFQSLKNSKVDCTCADSFLYDSKEQAIFLDVMRTKFRNI